MSWPLPPGMLIARTGRVISTRVAGEPLGVDDPVAFVEAVLKLADAVSMDHLGWGTGFIHASRSQWISCFEKPPPCAQSRQMPVSAGKTRSNSSTATRSGCAVR